MICLNKIAPVATNIIAQNVRFTGSASWTINANNVLIFEGVLSSDDPNYRITGITGTNPRDSTVVLKNTNTFAGGIGANAIGIEFYHPRAVLPYIPPKPTNAFFSINWSGMLFSSPPGRYYKYVINSNCGYYVGNDAGFRVMDSTKVVYNGIISDPTPASGRGILRAGPGYM